MNKERINKGNKTQKMTEKFFLKWILLNMARYLISLVIHNESDHKKDDNLFLGLKKIIW